MIIFLATFVFNIEGEFALCAATHVGPWYVCAMPPIVIEVFSYRVIKRRSLPLIFLALGMTVGLNLLDRAISSGTVHVSFWVTIIVILVPSLAGALALLTGTQAPQPARKHAHEPAQPRRFAPAPASRIALVRETSSDEPAPTPQKAAPAGKTNAATLRRQEIVEEIRRAIQDGRTPAWQEIAKKHGYSRRSAFGVLSAAKQSVPKTVTA